ncbi:DUF1611 domain-containing protein [Desulfobacteraceae bacterium SEEP-SAG9]|nr:DUF1611 domain-containing protein [Desulfobacteraceae bacterium SEEP-SAG9]
MKAWPEGNAVVYCEGAFNTPNGKTAHGLVRFTERYRVKAIIDSCHDGLDAGQVLDGKPNGIPIFRDLHDSIASVSRNNETVTHFVIGLAPDGGRLSASARQEVVHAIESGLNIDAGLHDFLSEDPMISALASQKGVRIRDVRKPPPPDRLHFFSGKIKSVTSLKIAVLGTDSAVGKRTTAWKIVQGFNRSGLRVEMIGTGQTAWMQGAKYSIILDSLINDFVSGEIEHAVWSAWFEGNPDVIVIEGQGSLMNPAYPGGFEILAAGRPDIVVLQHAPARGEYDGFPGYPIHPLSRQIQAIGLLSGKPVVAVTVNHEGLTEEQIPIVCDGIQKEVGLPAFDVLKEDTAGLLAILMSYRIR